MTSHTVFLQYFLGQVKKNVSRPDFYKIKRELAGGFFCYLLFPIARFLYTLRLGLSRLCSATFEQLLAFGATFCGFSNLEQVLPFRAIFEQNIGLEHISSTKKSTISWKTSIHANFLKAYHVINLLNT